MKFNQSYVMSSNTKLPFLNKSTCSDYATCNSRGVPKTSGELVSLKKCLNKLLKDINELRISTNKLSIENEENKQAINEAIISSRTTSNPINLRKKYKNLARHNRNNSMDNIKEAKEDNIDEKATLPAFSYHKLIDKNLISAKKHEIFLCQKMIREREYKIKELLLESKCTNLLQRNQLLLETRNKIGTFEMKNEELTNNIIPEKEKILESLTSQVGYYTTVNAALKNDNTTLKEKLTLNKEEHTKKNKAVSSLEEKNNSLQFQCNTLKQNEAKKVAEIKLFKEKICQIPDIKSYNNENNKKISENQKIINHLKEELNHKNELLEKAKKENDALLSDFSAKERKEQREMLREKEEYNAIRNEIEKIDKEKTKVKSNNYDLAVEIEKKEKAYERLKNGHTKMIQEKAVAFKISFEEISFQLIASAPKKESTWADQKKSQSQGEEEINNTEIQNERVLKKNDNSKSRSNPSTPKKKKCINQ